MFDAPDGGHTDAVGWCAPVRSEVTKAWSVHGGKRQQEHQIVLYDSGKLVFWSADPFDNGIAVPAHVIEGLFKAARSAPPAPEAMEELVLRPLTTRHPHRSGPSAGALNQVRGNAPEATDG